MEKISELAIFLRSRRQVLSESCQEFYNEYRSKLGVEFTAYRNYENGNRTPDIDFLKRIAPILKVDLKTLCHLWARSKMPCDETRELFEGIPGYFPKVVVRAKAEEIYRFSRSDIPYMEKNPELFVISSILATHHDIPLSVSYISKGLSLAKESTLRQLKVLENMGIIREISKDHYQSNYKDIANSRDDPFFDKARNLFYDCAYRMLMKSITVGKKQAQLANKLSFTFRPTEANVKIIHTKFLEIESMLMQMPDEGEKVHSLMILFSDIMENPNSKK